MRVENFFEGYICIEVELEKAEIFCFQKVEDKVGWVVDFASAQEHISHIQILCETYSQNRGTYTQLEL